MREHATFYEEACSSSEFTSRCRRYDTDINFHVNQGCRKRVARLRRVCASLVTRSSGFRILRIILHHQGTRDETSRETCLTDVCFMQSESHRYYGQMLDRAKCSERKRKRIGSPRSPRRFLLGDRAESSTITIPFREGRNFISRAHVIKKTRVYEFTRRCSTVALPL